MYIREPPLLKFWQCTPAITVLLLVHGGLGQWSDWSNCDVSCGIGWRERFKKCDNPKPKYGGKECSPVKVWIQKQFCDTYKKCSGKWVI